MKQSQEKASYLTRIVAHCYIDPFCVAAFRGDNKSLYSCKTSFSALHTLGDGEVVQSTNEGYSSIT